MPLGRLSSTAAKVPKSKDDWEQKKREILEKRIETAARAQESIAKKFPRLGLTVTTLQADRCIGVGYAKDSYTGLDLCLIYKAITSHGHSLARVSACSAITDLEISCR